MLNASIDTLPQYKLLRQELRSIQIHKFDLVHFEIGTAQNREFYLLNFIRELFPKQKISVTLHGPAEVISAPMSFLGFGKKPRIIRAIRKSLDLTIGNWWIYKALSKIDLIITLTEKGRLSLLQRYKGIPDVKVNYVPLLSYRCREEILECKSRTYNPTPNRILFGGYISPKKGVDLLIRAFALCLQKSSSFPPNIMLYICGRVPARRESQAYYRHLHNLSTKLGVQNNIHFMSNVSEDQKGSLFNESDVLVLPYKRNDRLFDASSVLIQGMSYGLPILTSDAKGFSTEVKDRRTGLLFCDGDVKMLSEKLDLLCRSKELRERLGKNALQHVLSEHEQQEVVQRISRLWKAM